MNTFLRNNIIELTSIFVLISLVFSNMVNSISIIVFLLVALLLKQKLYSNIFNGYTIAFLLLFVCIFISAIVSENQGAGFKFLERNLSMVIFPIIFAVIVKTRVKKSLIFKGFLVLISILLILAFGIALYKKLQYNVLKDLPFYTFKSWFFTYHYLAGNIFCTAIYLSLFLSFAIILLVLDLLEGAVLNLKITKGAKKLWLLCLLFFLVLLSARTILSITTVLLLFLFFKNARKKGKLKNFFLTLIILAIPLVFFIMKNDVLRLRIQAAFSLKENTEYFSGGLSSRIYQWREIVDDVINYNLFYGNGVGDVNKSYHKIYDAAGLDWALKEQFNAHNMYIEVFFSMGLFGLLILLTILYFSVQKAIKSSEKAYLLFLLIFCTAGLTESLMNRQYGIVYFTFLNSLFYFNSTRDKI